MLFSGTHQVQTRSRMGLKSVAAIFSVEHSRKIVTVDSLLIRDIFCEKTMSRSEIFRLYIFE